MPSGEPVPLFDIPDLYRPKKRKASADPNAVKWSKFAGHATCDLCIMNIHDGISDTVLSMAKHSYTKGERRWLLCSIHAAQVRNGERKLGG